MNKMEVDTSTPLYDDDYYIELQKFLEQYNDYDFSITYGTDDQSIGIVTSDHLDIAQMVMLILSVIIGALVLVVFCTVLSGKARAVSASWYSYSLALETIILALIFTPIVHARDFGLSLHHFCRVEHTRMGLGLIRAMNIVCINTEIIFTIVLPLQAWISSTSRRFLLVLSSTWIIGFVFTEMVHDVLPSIHADGCFLEDNHVANVAIHILLNWFPGFLVLALTIASIIAYSKGCFLTQMDTRDTRSREQNLQVRMRAHEWFRFLIIVNAQYFLLDLVLVEVIDNGLSQHDGQLMNIIYLTVAHELLRLVLPLSLLVISSVRSAICDGLCLPYTVILKCRKRNSQDEEALTMASAYADQLV